MSGIPAPTTSTDDGADADAADHAAEVAATGRAAGTAAGLRRLARPFEGARVSPAAGTPPVG